MPGTSPWMRRISGKMGSPGKSRIVDCTVPTRILLHSWLWQRMPARFYDAAGFDDVEGIVYDRNAGWSSLVARWAHNPKVGGSNPPPATIYGFEGLLE